VAVAKVESSFAGVAKRQRIKLTEHGVVFGTLEDHDLFHQNAAKLLIELKQVDFCEDLLATTSALLRKCPRLARVTLRTGNLEEDQAKTFMTKVGDTAKELAGAANRNIIVAMESKESDETDMKFRKAVEAKRNDEWLRSGCH
jgi:hypothetical protein